MSTRDPLPSWPRRYFEPGGGNAHLFYAIHGRFREMPQISRARYRCDGVPAECDLQIYARTTQPEVFEIGLDNYLGAMLRKDDPTLFDAASSSEQCLVLRGELSDPPTLDYFRDVVGLVMALLDGGGTAVFDPHAFKWWSPQQWRELAFDPAAAVPRHHVSILVTDDWYHTRGMIKFGRPDLSVHGVVPELEAAVQDLCNRFIEMQAFGAVVPEGQPIKMSSLPTGWRCFHRGSLDDPDFNNRHLEIGPG
jgi:hypothetical protein